MLLAVVFPSEFYHGSLLPAGSIMEKEKICCSRCCTLGERRCPTIICLRGHSLFVFLSLRELAALAAQWYLL